MAHQESYFARLSERLKQPLAVGIVRETVRANPAPDLRRIPTEEMHAAGWFEVTHVAGPWMSEMYKSPTIQGQLAWGGRWPGLIRMADPKQVRDVFSAFDLAGVERDLADLLAEEGALAFEDDGDTLMSPLEMYFASEWDDMLGDVMRVWVRYPTER